ncbi:MAG: polymer-forming cytoskeletal protein [Lachnospiraceae bacterium]|nr:polymer-forming cytoskeletal protein [Ruminococcus sp.]MCM1274908.1 polymer-forming cytoskeletal protein [Lachnospiraceae bacterium]
MGIKDNFSQAVKELWKKDGQEQNPSRTGQPTELDNYLKQSSEQAETSQQNAQGLETGGGGVPLETPYYRNPAPPAAQGAAQNVQNNAPLQNTVPDGEPGVNMNVQNIRQNFGQNSQPAPEGQTAAQNVQQATPQAQTASQPQGAPVNANVQNVQNPQNVQNVQNTMPQGQTAYPNQGGYNPNVSGGYGQGGYGGGGGYVPPAAGAPMQAANEVDETTVISKNTVIDGNIRSLANMQIDGNIKGNVETTRNIDMSGKIVGDITCNNAGMNSAAMQGNVSLKGRLRMDRDTILIGDLSSQYADINGRIRGKLDIVGKAELKRDAIVFGDINASTIAVTDGAIIQGYVNTTFLSKEDSRNVFPEAISFDSTKDVQPNVAPKPNQG